MAGVNAYWHGEAGKSVPFSILLNMVETYYHPEIRNDNYPSLISRARKNRSDDTDMQRFKQELTTVLMGNREGLHPQALTEAAWYDEEDDTAFLRRLWLDLYPDEPMPSPPQS